MLGVDNLYRGNAFIIVAGAAVMQWLRCSGVLVGFKELKGSWKGAAIECALIKARDFPEIPQTLLFGQECVMHLGVANAREERPASLLMLEAGAISEKVPMGDLVTLPESFAKKRGDWTFDPSSGLYYGIKVVK